MTKHTGHIEFSYDGHDGVIWRHRRHPADTGEWLVDWANWGNVPAKAITGPLKTVVDYWIAKHKEGKA
jgi:hypothetical protein